jgi:phenylpropionate dioxygenase-like ring-hydroxylating dioxygenase large terminal subunit
MTEEANPPAPAESGTGRFSVVRLRRQWYVATDARPGRAMAVTILALPLVLFRDAAVRRGAADRCLHRTRRFPGTRGGELSALYHGWCPPAVAATTSPATARAGEEPGGGSARGRRATVFLREQDGLRSSALNGSSQRVPSSRPAASIT